ncbi:unnamed protein product [Agarophyton chilense]
MANNGPGATPAQLSAEAITSNQETLTELGCLLGAFRDVSCSIGMDVLAITLVPKPPNVITPIPQRPPPPLPRNNDGHSLKLISLVQDFTDNMFDSGYIVTRIQLKPVTPPGPEERKSWEITVAFDDEYQHVMPPYPSREREGQTNLLVATDAIATPPGTASNS